MAVVLVDTITDLDTEKVATTLAVMDRTAEDVLLEIIEGVPSFWAAAKVARTATMVAAEKRIVSE